MLGPGFHVRRASGAYEPTPAHRALCKDKSGRWDASFFGHDRTAPFRAMPGYVPVEVMNTSEDLIILTSESSRP